MKRRELYWRNTWFVHRHAPRDKRLRDLLLRSAFGALYIAAWAFYEIRTIGEIGWWGGVWTGCVGALGLGCAWLIRLNNARDDASFLRLSVRQSSAELSTREHRRKIADELLRTAILCDRAGAEALHQEKKMTEEHRGVCRRRTLDLARRLGMWEGYGKVEQALLLSAEGAWDWEAIGRYFGRVEDVRVLRWVLRLDEVLTPFEFLKSDLTPALQTTTRPGELEGEECLASYDLRPARNEARTMMVRCIAEGVRRGFYQESDEERRKNLLEVAEEMGASGDDLYVGEARVSEATQEDVERTARAALRRVQVMTGVIQYLGGPVEAELRLEDEPEEA